jgi:hypothetical protein
MATGWTRPSAPAPDEAGSRAAVPAAPDRVGMNELLGRVLGSVRQGLIVAGPPHPVKFALYRDWDKVVAANPEVIHRRDPGLAIFRGIEIINRLQEADGNKFLFYFSPDRDKKYLKENSILRDAIYGQYMKNSRINYEDHIDLEMQPIFETYDGIHHTIYGNRKIATVLFEDLRRRGWIK